MDNFSAAQSKHDNAENPAYSAASEADAKIDFLADDPDFIEESLQDAIVRIVDGETIAGVSVVSVLADSASSVAAKGRASAPLGLIASIERLASTVDQAACVAAARNMRVELHRAVESAATNECDEIAREYAADQVSSEKYSAVASSLLEE